MTSWWESHRPQAPERHDLPPHAEVVVVGAGVAGLAVATELVERGRDVQVLEARRPAVGTTGSSTAKVTALHGAGLATVARHHGEEGVRRYVAANLRGLEHLRRTVERLQLECGWSTTYATTFTTDPDRVDELREEHRLGSDAGLALQWLDRLDELPVPVAGAVRLDEQAAVDPVALCAGLARHLAEAGHAVTTGCRVFDVSRVDDGSWEVRTSMGTVTAGAVVIATLLPVVDPTFEFAEASPMMSHALAATLRTEVPPGLHLGIDDPVRSIRPLGPGSRIGIFGGSGHRVGEGDPAAARDDLRSWVQDHFDVARIEAEWDAHDIVPADGVPSIGRTDDGERPELGRFVATGFKKWGFTHAGAAALLIADELDGRSTEWAPPFDPRRHLPSAGAAAEVARGNLSVARHLVGDKIRTLRPPPADQLRPGEGDIVDVDGTKVAAARRDDGTLVVRSATCTHLGCQVAWNGASSTWDCPCHGSRFDVDGSVLAGPATRPLGEPGEDGPGEKGAADGEPPDGAPDERPDQGSGGGSSESGANRPSAGASS